MIELMQMDKKSTSKNIVFILPTDYSTVNQFEIPPSEISFTVSS